MDTNKYIVRSFLNALGVFVYVSLVAVMMFNIEHIFGNKPDNFLAPVFMLLLFIISASVTGLLVLGKPIYLLTKGLKKEAATLLFATIAWLVAFLLIVVGLLMLV